MLKPLYSDSVFIVFTFKEAEELAKTWVRIASDNTCKVTRIDDKPYGWVFFYRGKNYNPDDASTLVAGNAPIIVNRINLEIVVTGTAHPIEHYIGEYEKSLPEAWLEMTPERHDGLKKFGPNDR